MPPQHIDAQIADLAGRQHGVISRGQLRRAGLSARSIDRRLSQGRLVALFRGVYRVGPVAGAHARAMAAVLACGSDAVVSHATASVAWIRLPPLASDAPVDVTATRRRRIAGIRAHQGRLRPEEATTLEGVPITTPARTLLDLASLLGPHELERAVAQAVRAGLCDPEQILSLLAEHPRHAGNVALRRLVAGDHAPALTRSEAEQRLLQLIRRARLRPPQTNARLHGYEVDFLWPTDRLVVEVDGYAYHSSAAAFARDRRRDRELLAAGYRVVRLTWDDVARHPETTLVALARALSP
jgi:very-short-patch-repair endonuclease